MARVLWIGDAGCHTGFGRVTHSIGERLVERGHDIHVLAHNYTGDFWPTNLKLYRANTIIPTDMYGQARMVEMLARVEPEVVVIVNDPYVIRKFLWNNNWDPQKLLLQYRPILAYMPIDGINQPKTWDILKVATHPVLMSQWGLTWMPEGHVVHHGVGPEFRKATEAAPMTSSGGVTVTDRSSAKRAIGYPPDSFLVVRVDRNSRRKDFGATWKALLPVMRAHPEVIAHFHCKFSGEDGVEINHLLSREPDLAARFYEPGNHSTNEGWPETDLAILYNAADLVVSTSWGEGFGLTLAEAAACGTPIVAQNVSSITEVVGPGGLLIEPLTTTTVTSGEDQWLPDVAAFTEAIEHLYADPAQRTTLGEAGRQHSARFSWDEAADAFDRLIEELAVAAREDGDKDARADRKVPDLQRTPKRRHKVRT